MRYTYRPISTRLRQWRLLRRPLSYGDLVCGKLQRAGPVIFKKVMRSVHEGVFRMEGLWNATQGLRGRPQVHSLGIT